MNVVVTVGEELVEGEGWGGREGDSDISACLLTAVCNTQVLIKIALEGGSREGGRDKSYQTLVVYMWATDLPCDGC